MTITDVQKKVNELKRNYGKLQSNIIWMNLREAQIDYAYQNPRAIVFTVQEPFRVRGYFAGVDGESIAEVLQMLPKGTVVEYLFREENDMKQCFENGSLDEYACYIRQTCIYAENPYHMPETGNQKLLQESYDPDFGEYPQEADVEELYQLMKDTFDPICDDMFTRERWKEIIDNKECLIGRHNNKIVSVYVWRLEGKKMYINIMINRGPANYRYNLERYVFEQIWEAGVRCTYVWCNVKNERAVKHWIERAARESKSSETLYNGVFVKM